MSGIVFAYSNFNRVGDDKPTVVNSLDKRGQNRSGPMWYILGAMIVGSVAYGVHKVRSRRKEEFGVPHSFLLR